MKKKNKPSIKMLREQALKNNLQRRKEVKQGDKNNNGIKFHE